MGQAEQRMEKLIPFQDKQIDAGNSDSVFNAGEQINVGQQFIEVLAACLSSKSIDKYGEGTKGLRHRALMQWYLFLKNDVTLQKKFRPTK